MKNKGNVLSTVITVIVSVAAVVGIGNLIFSHRNFLGVKDVDTNITTSSDELKKLNQSTDKKI